MVSVHQDTQDSALYRKDLLPVVFVTADMAGTLDSPLYGMFEAVSELDTRRGERSGTKLYSCTGHGYQARHQMGW